MSDDGFWSLRNAPSWWRHASTRWLILGLMAVLLGSRWYHGPGRVPAGRVVVYGADWCPYTRALRAHLAASGIPFEERDVDASFEDAVRFSWAAGRGGMLPLVQVGPRVVSKGYVRQPIDHALRAAGFNPSDDPGGPEGASERR